MRSGDELLTDAVVATRTGSSTVSQALRFLVRKRTPPAAVEDAAQPPSPSPVVYTYDGRGRVERVEYGAPVVRTRTLSRNESGQVTLLVDAWKAGTRTCTFSYDAAGHRTQIACAFEEASES